MSDIARITIALPREAYERLSESAKRDMRQPRQQALWLLYQALGLVPVRQVGLTDKGKELIYGINVPLSITEIEMLRTLARLEGQHPRDYARNLFKKALAL
jgi:hypothetical protein